ncbi:MAG: hypothetical protein MUC38_06100 [Cyclobacteriaceae bacterium]|jgi:hypothetical protein|nr:hypothetical protein [Cyclobacteriaceae bacterium]
MKRVVAYLLTCVLLVQIAGFYLFLAGRLAYLHEQSRAQLKDKPIELLQRLELSEHQYRQARVNPREVKLEGKMYDIARLERVHGRVILYAEHDEAEDNLLAFVNKVFEIASADDKPLPPHFIKWLFVHYLIGCRVELSAPSAHRMEPTGWVASRPPLWVDAQDTPPPKV